MASLISDSFKDVVTVKIKERHDDFTDQYTRIFIVKMLILSTLVTGLGNNINNTLFSKIFVHIFAISTLFWTFANVYTHAIVLFKSFAKY